MLRYEVLLAEGDSIEAFQTDINRIANIRHYEIEHELDQSFDVVDHKAYWFKPESPITIEGGYYYRQVWMRQKP